VLVNQENARRALEYFGKLKIYLPSGGADYHYCIYMQDFLKAVGEEAARAGKPPHRSFKIPEVKKEVSPPKPKKGPASKTFPKKSRKTNRILSKVARRGARNAKK
jgi:hypothetical protein